MKILICQCLNVVSFVDEALSQLVSTINEGKINGVDLIIFPELFLGGYPNQALKNINSSFKNSSQEEIVNKVIKISKNFNIAILFGMIKTYYDKQFNTAILVSSNGEVLTEYHKINLFGDYENTIFSPGVTSATIVNFLGQKVALGICYDVETESFIKDLSHRGAEIIFGIAANMQPYENVSQTIIPYLCKKYRVQIVYANYVGYDSFYTFCGRSCVTNMNGTHLFLGSSSKPGNYIVIL
ncbi:nitrilase-related carbon-nitrogen hydrolase [Acidithiobacillus thiooxidans]|uniref:Hydrolase in pqqF 5'region n=1 Tax=Acidithiobacillus thiooxidans ATCC 19377 TaxID=637390 RepID=A0A543Q031_ACITH|nr:nitrilase-related carbon-nitrogen hydrolase [Acidithiobacillus thiooxidans]MDX5936349.1 nitrilase-related carbon-nitrogen hydrolase [Acidithiobacillus thiooxidans]TQN49650.1 Hydrolase in pqqF 5'region [Acidithiobacillus thiooxidans ATCC 19377]